MAQFPKDHIVNAYVAKVKPGKHSLIIPLGAKADLSIRMPESASLPKGIYTLTLTDISGITWEEAMVETESHDKRLFPTIPSDGVSLL